MADMNKVLAGAVAPANISTTQGTANTSTVVTVAAPSANTALLITKILITADGTPAASVRATVAHGSTTMFTLLVPTDTFGVEIDFGTHPVALPAGESVVVTVPALGSGVSCDASVFTVPSAP